MAWSAVGAPYLRFSTLGCTTPSPPALDRVEAVPVDSDLTMPVVYLR